MELRQLKYFIAVADDLHFGRAAARVGIEQSPLSKAIKDFESELGVLLFHRTTRRTELTPAGEAFLSDARCVLAAAERATRNLVQRTQSIELGIEPGLCGEHLITWLMRWRTRAAPTEIRLTEIRRPELIAQHESHVLDAAILTVARSEPEFQTHLLWRDPWLVLLPRGHTLSDRSNIGLQDLADERVFVSEHAAERFTLPQAQVVPAGVLTSLVSAGYGVGIANREALAAAGSQTLQRPLLDKPSPLTVSLVWLPERSTRVERLLSVEAVAGVNPTAIVPAASRAPS